MAHVVFLDSRPYGFRAVRTAKRLGHAVTFVASDAYAAAYRGPDFDALCGHIDRVVTMPDSTRQDDLRQVLQAIDRQRAVDALIATHDEIVQSAALVAAALGIRFTGAAGVANARDKARSRRRLEAAGLRTVDYAVVDDVLGVRAALDRVGYPAVVKPAAGSASVAASIIRGPGDVPAAVRKIEQAGRWLSASQRAGYGRTLIVERYLDGPLMSVEVAAAGGDAIPLAVLQRQRYVADQTMELGSVAPADLSAEQDKHVRRYAQDVVAALGLDLGLFHVEVIVDADGPCLIDPNPRLVGGPNALLVRECWGVDLHEWLLAAHLGGLLPTPRGRARTHGGAHVLAPARDAVHRVGADLAFLDGDPRVRSWRLSARAGEAVRAAQSNLQYLGHVLCTGDSRRDVVSACTEAVSRIADETSIAMLTWDGHGG